MANECMLTFSNLMEYSLLIQRQHLYIDVNSHKHTLRTDVVPIFVVPIHAFLLSGET